MAKLIANLVVVVLLSEYGDEMVHRCLTHALQMSGRADVISPTSWGAAKTSAALRKQSATDVASTFVPLLDWSEDTQGNPDLHPGQLSEDQAQTKIIRSDPAAAGNNAASSDASISSSDDEFAPNKKSLQRITRLKRKQHCQS